MMAGIAVNREGIEQIMRMVLEHDELLTRDKIAELFSLIRGRMAEDEREIRRMSEKVERVCFALETALQDWDEEEDEDE